MRSAASLRRELSERNQQAALAQSLSHELTVGEIPSVIFACDDQGRHGNFHTVSWRNIRANPQWARRLRKVHTASRKPSLTSGRRWMELDCANSSDALLMNIFCYRRRLQNQDLVSLLGVDAGASPEFGVRPGIALRAGKTDRTEIDMQLGNLLVEAKLTESDFQTAPVQLIERYRDFEEVFESERLRIRNNVVSSYQLIRGALAAHATGNSFCVFCDARRTDLIEQWYAVMSAVRSCTLRCRLKLLTWQELATSLPMSLQRFLAAKYGIDP
jgi:hypothetical protein